MYSKDDVNASMIPITNNFLYEDIAFNCDTIKIILKQLRNTFSVGSDVIPTFTLNRFSDEICLPTALIFQKS